jgi:hypothetical protein
MTIITGLQELFATNGMQWWPVIIIITDWPPVNALYFSYILLAIINFLFSGLC